MRGPLGALIALGLMALLPVNAHATGATRDCGSLTFLKEIYPVAGKLGVTAKDVSCSPARALMRKAIGKPKKSTRPWDCQYFRGRYECMRGHRQVTAQFLASRSCAAFTDRGEPCMSKREARLYARKAPANVISRKGSTATPTINYSYCFRLSVSSWGCRLSWYVGHIVYNGWVVPSLTTRQSEVWWRIRYRFVGTDEYCKHELKKRDCSEVVRS